MNAETPPIILKYLEAMNEHTASDMYMTVGSPPAIRTEDTLINLGELALDAENIEDILSSILTSRQRRTFDTQMELNASLDVGHVGRFRVNVLRQRQNPAIVIRRIVSQIPTFEELKLPKILESLSMEKRGLVLLTGITGSGKSTTLASMVDYRNQHLAGHVITIEDPIEYFHDHKRSIITQREIGVDTESYAIAMKNALRQRPDVMLVGEIRDREVMEQALTVTETGHLCLSTIHTTNTYQSIERIVNLFPEEMGSQIRLNLSLNLKAIISQRLVSGAQGGLVPVVEIMLNQGSVRDLILTGDIKKIPSVIEQNNALGMCSFDQSLLALYRDGLITEETAVNNSDRPSDMKIKLKNQSLAENDIGLDSALTSYDTSSISIRD